MSTYGNRSRYLEAQEIAAWLTPIQTTGTLGARYQQRDGTSEDQGAGAISGSDGSRLPDLGTLASFDNWLSVASTILYRASSLAKWNPASTTFDSDAWNAYLYKVGTIPFFLMTDSKSRDVSITSTSLKGTIDAVSDMIGAITTGDVLNGVITSIQKIATLAIENQGLTQKDNQQTQGVLSVKASNLYVGCFWTSITMEYKKGKGYEQLNQSISIRRFYGVLDFAKCQRNSDAIKQWDGQSVGDWGNNTGSAGKQPNQSPAWNN